MLVAVCSDKGSPGATTTALALAAAWPTPAVVVEADPYGGDLPLRLRTSKGAALPETPTVLTLATAARSGGAGTLLGYAHRLNDQVSVVPGFIAVEQVGAVRDWEPLARSLRAAEAPVIVDVGRLHTGSPMLPIAAAADVVVVVGRADTEAVLRLRERMCRLAPALAQATGEPPRLWPVLVTKDRHGVRDLEDLGAVLADTEAGPFVAGYGFVAFDPGAAGRLESGENPAAWLGRTALMRTARRLARELASGPTVAVQARRPTHV